jgi:hypothetical protein
MEGSIEEATAEAFGLKPVTHPSLYSVGAYLQPPLKLDFISILEVPNF